MENTIIGKGFRGGINPKMCNSTVNFMKKMHINIFVHKGSGWPIVIITFRTQRVIF